MPDPRVQKLASVLVHYSLDVQPGHKIIVRTTTLGEELALAVYREALLAGAYVTLNCEFPGASEIFFRNASDAQIDYVEPHSKTILETYDRSLSIGAEQNSRDLSAVSPERRARRSQANRGLMKILMDRTARGEMSWCYTQFPTHASAQDADMSLADYEDFVYKAGKLDTPDPVAEWQAFGLRMRQLTDWLAGRDHMVLKGKDIDLSLSIRGRTFEAADGKANFPDGEIFSGPVEDSVNGWVRYQYPAIYGGREVTNIELRFENGKVVSEKADKGQDLLTSLLNQDAGARYLGEIGIGTNYDIPRFTKNMLFDEKLGGTFHFAGGASYPETGGVNESGLHWDMLCDMSDSEVQVDGELFYRNGKPVLWENR